MLRSLYTSQVVDLYINENLTCAQISTRTGISPAYVRTLLHKSGVKLRPAGFQLGNTAGSGRSLSESSRLTISEKHKASGHKPSRSTIERSHQAHARTDVDKLLARYKRASRARGIVFALLPEQFMRLINSDCHYCGVPPRPSKTLKSAFNGVDRFDNALGYVDGNVVACCTLCNRMKSMMGGDEFVEHCVRIAGRKKWAA